MTEFSRQPIRPVAAGPPPPPAIGCGLIWLLAITCGVGVGNAYFAQAVSPLVASGLHVPQDSAAVIVTVTQCGYTAGILLVPLSDRFPHRRLIVTLLLLTGLGLLG